MLKDLKVAQKVALMPALAAIGFPLVLVVSQQLGSRSADQLTAIQQGYFPALEASRDLEEALTGIQRALQAAVTARDAGLLAESDVLRDRFQAILAAQAHNP